MENKIEFIINVAYLAVIIGLVFLAIYYLLPILTPFILGFLFAYVARRLCRHYKKDAKPYRILTLSLIYLAILILIIVIVSSGVSGIVEFIVALPNVYVNTIEPALTSFENVLMNLNDVFPEAIAETISGSLDSIFEAIRSLLSSGLNVLVSATTTVIKNTPSVLVDIIIMLISSFYILLDYEGIARWFVNICPPKVMTVCADIKDFCENVLIRIIGCYAVIMFMTFAELFLGFSIFGIANGGLWAALIAVLDILPVLGVGTVLIPWGLVALIIGNTLLGIEILLLYLIITIIRNIVEPHLVGGNLGLHPLATLMAMITGANTLGFIGMFGLPLTLSFILRYTQKKKDGLKTGEKD